jgi:hypothetical protein
LTYLDVVGEPGDPGLKRVTVRVYASTEAPEEQVRAVWEALLARSPLACTLAPVVRLELVLQVVP